MPRLVLCLFVGTLVAPHALAQQQLRFHWQKGQVLTYKVEHNTTNTEVLGGTKTETGTKLSLVKRWQVLDVDDKGVATLQLSLTSMKLETLTPGRDTLTFDSANYDKSTPGMREQLKGFVGQPLAVLRLDGRGQVVEVKESKHGPASRYENEIPFVGVLPADASRPGQTWERAYHITLDPPQGTGEKYDAVQRLSCDKLEGGIATIKMTTEVKSLPKAMADQVPLMQLQPEGEIAFDVASGRLKSAQLRTQKELKDHQGPGSSYKFLGTYVEQYVGDR